MSESVWCSLGDACGLAPILQSSNSITADICPLYVLKSYVETRPTHRLHLEGSTCIHVYVPHR